MTGIVWLVMQQAGLIGCRRYATVVRRGGRRAQYQVLRRRRITEGARQAGKLCAQMQVRVQAAAGVQGRQPL